MNVLYECYQASLIKLKNYLLSFCDFCTPFFSRFGHDTCYKKMDLKAVVMAAGTGSRMREITSGIPKCLLPVGNIPLISSSLNILKQAGFLEAIIIVRENEKAKVQNAIENKFDLKLDIVGIPKHEDWGTADSLRHIKDKIKSSNVIVLSCDIVSDFALQNMIHLHRLRGSSLTVLLVPFPKSLKEAEVPGSKKKCKFERDIIAMDSHGKLIFINAEADFEETVPFKRNILEQNNEIKIYSNLMDAHIYIINQDLVNFIMNNVQISTLKGEFLPAAVKQQFNFKKQNNNTECNESSLAPILNQECIDLKKLAFDLSSANYSMYNSQPTLENKLVCFSYIDKDCFCTRVNTLVAFANINKKISNSFSLMGVEQVKSHQFQKSQVDSVSVVGENCELLPKSSIKQSALGSNCKLGEKTKITNSIIMDNVTFGKECVIQNSIICSNVVMENNCSLKNSIIGPDQTVQVLTKLNCEILQGSDHLMEI
ncbi:translation initiation factor eIF-2B subunit gamma [Nephila pilipes]|uniref:Translation initiation factor eIF2B subunit gamma n=1 Tax=Nephila pilipes TaxID=299642 RepID=A0A8X6QK44_NEPPI|nr:translation initiation factor eIF-2B subunit gamma [Nephila pilipes]